MKKVFLCRSIPVSEDSRVLRYSKLIQEQGLKVIYVQWGAAGPASDVITAPVPRLRGRPYLNILLTPIFSLWLFIFIIKNTKKGDVVLAVDLDTGLPALIGSYLKKASFIYDIADPFSLCRFNKSIKIINWLEGKVAKSARMAILPSKARSCFYPKDIAFRIIENVPNFTNLSFNKPAFPESKLSLGYFGTLEGKYRGLEILAKAVLDRDDLVFHVGGTGALSDYFKELSIEYPDKFAFYGRFAPNDLPHLIYNCELLVAIYSAQKEHHKYVAANKLYEHLACSRAVLTNSGTNFAEDIRDWDTGWVVSEDYTAVCSVLDVVLADKTKLYSKSKKAELLWASFYKEYWACSKDVKDFLSFVVKD